MIRKATIGDLDGLVRLEERCFDSDRLSRRSFRHLLTRANASTLVWDDDGPLGGYVTILFSRATALARLYSIAVDSSLRGKGAGRALLAAAETEALEHGCVSMRSEVRRDNAASLAMFRAAGYRQFDEVEDYYSDHMEALRFERTLVPQPSLAQVLVPYYQQTTEFTCGPACLMMAMRALDPELPLDRRLELRLWRESTSVYMASGHGGCGPYGLAAAADARGFGVELFVKEQGPFLVDTVRDPAKKDVMRLVEEDYLDRLAERGVPVTLSPLGLDALRDRFEEGAIPVLLISSWRIYRTRTPHWVVVTGFDDRFVYVHDPFVDDEEDETVADCIAMPIARAELERMARYGRTGQRAALLLSRRAGEAS